MIVKNLANWLEKKETEAYEEGSGAKIFGVGFIEGATDTALVAGLVLAATGWALMIHEGLHKLSDK